MPNKYVSAAERERKAQTKKCIQTLSAICDDPTASSQTKLESVKLLKPITELQQQLNIKDEQISRKDEEIRELNEQLERKRQEFDGVQKQLEAALLDKKAYERRIEELETEKKRLTSERTDCNEQLTTTETERNAAIARADSAEAVVTNLLQTLQILADEFVPAGKRDSIALQHFQRYDTKLSPHWYQLLGFPDVRRYLEELAKLKELMGEARRQMRPPHPLVFYHESDEEIFGAIFLYQLVRERDNWLEKSLVDFFQSEGVDYSKWLKWDSAESSATDNEWERKKFLEARQAYNQALKLGRYLILPVSTPEAANDEG